METVGDYEFQKADLIGHGAFAVVYKGRVKKVGFAPDSTSAFRSVPFPWFWDPDWQNTAVLPLYIPQPCQDHSCVASEMRKLNSLCW